MEKTTLCNPKIHGRHSIRLPEFDYSNAGYYFVTICTKDRKRLFGRIRDQKMELNGLGKIARDELLKTPSLRPNVRIDAWVVMPDHVHVIFEIRQDTNLLTNGNIQEGVGAWRAMPLPHDDDPRQKRQFSKPQPDSVPTFVGAYKSSVTKQIHFFAPDINVWQRNYWERVLFDDGERDYYRTYIRDNPKNQKG